MSHNTLENYYKSVFNLVQQLRFSTITELENMVVYERDIYIALITEDIAIKEEKIKQQQALAAAAAQRRF